MSLSPPPTEILKTMDSRPLPSPPTIKLRPFRLTDVDDFLKLVGDDRVVKFTRWDTFTSREQALEFLEQTAIPAPWHRAICLTSVDNPVVGIILLHPGTGNDRCRGVLGYGLAAEYWCRGIATAAVRAAVQMVFDEFAEIERVEGLVDVENFASQRVLEKNGFFKEGVMRKHNVIKGKIRDNIMYSFLRTDLRN